MLVNKKTNSPGLPPSTNVGTLETSEAEFPSTEKELAAYLYLKHGSGTYTVLVHRGVLRSAWRGDVEKRRDRRGRNSVVFKAQEKNSLEYHANVTEETSPDEDSWGRIDDPREVVPDYLY